MPLKAILLSGVGIIAAATLGLTIATQSTASPEPNELDKEVMTEMVREILVENPDIIIDALDAYSAQQRQLEEQQMAQIIEQYRPALLSAEHGAAYGASDAERKVVVVELFDYHCTFCKKATNYVRQLPEKDKTIQVIFRELPILREESEIAARHSLAARAQGKYKEYHWAMMGTSGVLTEKRMDNIAKNLGINVKALDSETKTPAVQEAINETLTIAQALNVTGTPTFIILTPEGDFSAVVSGFDQPAIEAAIAEAKTQ